MQRRRKRTEALSPQSLWLHPHCAPSRITTRTVIESVKSTCCRNARFRMAKVPIVTSDSHGSGQTMNKAVVKICSDRVQASSVLLARNAGATRLQNLGSLVANCLLDGYGREAGVGRGHGVGAHLAVHGVEVGVGIGVIVDVGVLVGVAVVVGVGVGLGVMVGIGVGVAVGVTVGVRVGVPPAGATTRLSTTKIGP